MFIKNIELPKIVENLAEAEYLIALNQEVSVLSEESVIRFDEGGFVSFDAPLNRIDVKHWKGNVLIDVPQLNLKGSGRFLIRFGLHRHGHAHKWLWEQEIDLNEAAGVNIDLFFWDKLEAGTVYFTLQALTPGFIFSGSFSSIKVTPNKPFISSAISTKSKIRMNPSMNPIQQLVMPSLMFSAPEEMYVRLWNDKVTARLSEKRICFREGGRVSFDTFFNGVTTGAWKKHCPIKDLSLNLCGKGRFLLRFGLHRIGHSHKWLFEQEIELQGETELLTIKLPFWSRLEEGLLYFALEAQQAAELWSGFYSAETRPTNEVKLGIVITHFNRKQYVLPAIDRIRDELLNDPYYKDKIELVVVDNSQNITSEEAKGITLIPNQNLGGSGGFTRGLLQLKDEGSFTHCLFMDDDASCEIESIKRAYALLSFADTPKFAISGSLLRELEPFRLFEKGATFPGVCQGLKSGLDMRTTHDLLFAELADKKPGYGAWWFFAFAIKDVDSFAFPFFVRGDDIFFGKSNQFDILTLNGIGCWGEDFGLKSGPLPRYLDTRNHIVQGFINYPQSRLSAVKLISQFFITPLFSYDYASARAAILAIKHASAGPTFWRENMDMADIRAEIGAYSGTEKMVPVDRSKYNIHYRNHYETKFHHFVRIITLNGFLLPDFLLKDAVAFQHKSFRATFSAIFRYKKVLYEYEPLGVGYIAYHDKNAFFKELKAFLKEITIFAVKYDSIKKSYLADLSDITSESFWRKVYSKKTK